MFGLGSVFVFCVRSISVCLFSFLFFSVFHFPSVVPFFSFLFFPFLVLFHFFFSSLSNIATHTIQLWSFLFFSFLFFSFLFFSFLFFSFLFFSFLFFSFLLFSFL